MQGYVEELIALVGGKTDPTADNNWSATDEPDESIHKPLSASMSKQTQSQDFIPPGRF